MSILVTSLQWVYMDMKRRRVHADADSYTRTQTEQSGNKTTKQSSLGTVSLTDRTQCMRMSSIDMGLDYDSMVMLTCKLQFAAAKAIVDISPDIPRQS